MFMFNDLRKLRPFRIIPNRFHEHFQDISLSPLVGQDRESFSCGFKTQEPDCHGVVCLSKY